MDPDYTCTVSVSGSGGAAYGPLLEALGISTGDVLWNSSPSSTEYFELDAHDLKLSARPEVVLGMKYLPQH